MFRKDVDFEAFERVMVHGAPAATHPRLVVLCLEHTVRPEGRPRKESQAVNDTNG